MSMHPLYGHYEARRRLARAIARGHLPQVILISGDGGVGKQRLGLWLGQLLLCANPGEEPCGECRSCRLIVGLGHPDLHWIIPIPRPKASDADRQVDEAAAALAQAVTERRGAPLYQPPDGMATHGIATARVILQRASLTPVEGRKKVFLIGEADRLVPQESSQEAANALLKMLEEPPQDTVFVLTTVDRNRLLPTIRSRAAPLRLGRLPDDEVARFLGKELPDLAADEGEVARRTSRARGSIGLALRGDDPDAAKARDLAEAFLKAALAPGHLRLFERALAQNPWSARGDFTAMLDAVAEALNDAAREALGHAPVGPVPVVLRGRPLRALVRAAAGVRRTRESAQGNVNPQLLVASLGAELAETL